MTSPGAPPSEPPLKSFRLLDGTTVIDLPFQPPAGSRVRVATVWPTPTDPSGWASRLWPVGPDGRGWIPVRLELGDVVGFAAELPTAAPPPAGRHRGSGRRQPAPEPVQPTTIYWYGYFHAVVAQVSMVLRGPYEDAVAAYAAAQRVLLAAAQAEQSTVDADAVPIELAQAPADVTVNWHNVNVIVGDPWHGWIHAPRDAFAAALAHPRDRLAALLTDHVDLTGQEATATLAALAARHVPAELPDITQLYPDAVPLPPAAGPGTPDPSGRAPGREPLDQEEPDPAVPEPHGPDPPGFGQPAPTPPPGPEPDLP